MKNMPENVPSQTQNAVEQQLKDDQREFWSDEKFDDLVAVITSQYEHDNSDEGRENVEACRSRTLERMIRGEISRQSIAGFFIRRRIRSGKVLELEVASLNRVKKALIAELIGKGFNEFVNVTQADVEEFLIYYPDISALSRATRRLNPLYKRITKNNTKLTADMAYRELVHLILGVYGGQEMLDWQCISELFDKARHCRTDKSSHEKELEQPPILKPLTAEDGQFISSACQIRGTLRMGEELTVEQLTNYGLGPVVELCFDDSRFAFSKMFYVTEGRPAVIGYVEAADEESGERKWYVRAFYQSQSHGLWRYLPDHEEGIWFGKGKQLAISEGIEQSITLPTFVQEALCLIKDKRVQELTEQTTKIFFKTARNLGERRRTPRSPKPVDPSQSFVLNVEAEPLKIEGCVKTIADYKVGYYENPPDYIELENIGQEPRLANGPLRQWKDETALYGNVTFETFLSNDESLIYLFCRDNKGRAWISFIENVQSPIVSNGVRSVWVDGGKLTTPAYEYSSQTYGYGGEHCERDSEYQDMFERFLSKIPLIQRYLASVEERERKSSGM